MSGSAISVVGLGKEYTLGNTAGGYSRLTEEISDAAARLLRRKPGDHVERSKRKIWALRDVDLEVAEGEVVGIVGRNGAGKSTFLKIMSRITEPTEGRVVVRGRISSLLEVGTGFHPELTGRENVYLNGAILGMRKREIDAAFDQIVGFAEVERFIDTPVKRYSSGMAVRLAFAVAAHLEPEILVVDEVLAVGDSAFQQKCIGRMGEIAKSGRTILFVSHNLASVAALCTKAVLLEKGRIIRNGEVDAVLDHYLESIQGSTGESLEDRNDRQGDGRLRVTRADVLGAKDGPPRTGLECEIRLRYRTDVPGGTVTVVVAVDGPLGEPMFFLGSSITGDQLATEDADGELVCAIPRFPLLPGRYSMTYYVEVNGEMADWVRNAISFDVFEADVFGTGRLPPTSYGRVIVPHTWSARPVER
jgi:lipopolysaccharide transport system ATP-binding protein